MLARTMICFVLCAIFCTFYIVRALAAVWTIWIFCKGTSNTSTKQ